MHTVSLFSLAFIIILFNLNMVCEITINITWHFCVWKSKKIKVTKEIFHCTLKDSKEHALRVQSRPHFCISDTEYSILTQNVMVVGSYWSKKSQTNKNQKNVTSYISASKAVGNSKSKLVITILIRECLQVQGYNKWYMMKWKSSILQMQKEIVGPGSAYSIIRLVWNDRPRG